MGFSIETDTPSYLYARMAAHIASRIESGELKPHDPLPAEKRLADHYGVSLGTARRATELLREQGLVLTLRAKGTFVTGKRELDSRHEYQTSPETIT